MSSKRSLCVLFILVAYLAGCSSLRLNYEVNQLNTERVVMGEVIKPASSTGRMYAIVYSIDKNNQITIVSTATVPEKKPHFFILSVEPRNDLRLVIYQDVDGDRKSKDGEPIWFYRNGEPIVFGPNRKSEMIQVRFSANASTLAPEIIRAIESATASAFALDYTNKQLSVKIGEIASFNDAKFAPKIGQKGLWEPFSYLHSPGIGLYFLEPYDATRIPVLFIHGAGGTPRDWAYVASILDRSRFQVWMFAYPSGRRLEDTAKDLSDIIEFTRNKYGFGEMLIFAHSMGGLIARRFLELDEIRQRPPLRGKFISVATPWFGHEAAELGVTYAPAVIPSWIDMRIGSDYTTALFKTPISANISSFLAFTYCGSSKFYLPESNDGTVSLESQLRWEAQLAAREVRGFNENHMSILKSRELTSWIKSLF